MDKYKISIWEDVDNGSTLQEQKIAEIGSDTMTAQYRALEPVLTENSNGTHTFTFKMYYHYVDNQTGEEVDNPFISLMVNERKVKVLWKNRWYDFIIKDVTKDSSNKSLSFSCQDLYVNELSKNGFNLEFDTELENNIGTISELAAKVLEGTDWNLGTSDTLIQYQEETLWDVLVTSATATPDRGGNSKTLTNKHVYMFNSSYQQGSGKVQFLYGTTPIATVDGSNVIIDKYQNSDSDWDCYSATLSSFSGSLTIYRGRRVVNSVKQIYDEKLNKYVDVYTKNSAIYYVNRTTSIETPQTISNLIINAKDFDSVIGWHTPSTNIGLTQVMWPTYTSTAGTAYTGKGYLKAVTLDAAGTYTSDIVPGPITLINDGLSANIISLPKEGLQIGQKYVVRSVAYEDNGGAPSTSTVALGFDGICTIKSIDSTTTTATYFTQIGSSPVWEVSSPITFEDLNKNVVSLNFTMPSETTWIEKVEFFPYAATESSYIEPNNFTNASYVVKEVYTVYSSDALSQEPTERASKQYNSLEEVINNDYVAETDQEKIRSINAKESNRFNILQTLAETFNCWAVFDITHNQQTGEITGKTVSFKERLGEETGLGFVYGIDLKTVSRNLNSTNIVTKTIVKQNSNEFGEDGFCTIARAKENYGKENFVLDFNYYINQGLLDGATINADLYGTTAPAIGYLYNLNQLNTSYDSNINTLVQDKQVLTQYQALLTVKSENVKALQQQIEVAQNTIITKMDETSWESAITSTKLEQPSPDGWVEMLNAIASEKLLEDKLAEEQLQLASLQDMVEQLESAIEDLKQAQESIIDQKEDLNEAFFTKYGSYLQEGTWVSEEYYDDTLYYLDALNVASTSAEPQVSYNISVLRLQALEEFKTKVFNIGDTVFIEDPEFFGYEWINGIKTPIRKKVLVSQIVSHFDNPTQDTITIQNYKTDFEDLFQRITASTQSLQFSSGSYNRAAGIVATNGGITGDVLQTTLTNNNNLVYQTLNNSITQDATGITLSDLSNPNNKVKITANGLYISDDGGINWKNAIRGNGIGTEYLSAGSIATNKINIYDGEWPTFRWDKDGLSAYRHENGNVYYDNFVRFDQYGVYGVKGQNDGVLDRWVPSDEEEIWDTANFGLTWNGFFLKSNNNGGYVSITSDDDIQVFRGSGSGATEAIKIGRIDGTSVDPVYGIYIKDTSGNKVLWTDENGKLYVDTSIYINNGDITIGLDTSTQRVALENSTILPNEDYYTDIDLTDPITIDFTQDYYIRSGTAPSYTYKKADKLVGGINYYIKTSTDPDTYSSDPVIPSTLYRTMSAVFNANQNFVVYEDGYMHAAEADITGAIYSSEGIFGDNAVIINSQGLNAGEVLIGNTGIQVSDFITINGTGIHTSDNSFEITPNGATFTGTVNASSGNFSGTIEAKDGKIGGFTITETNLVSADETIKLNGAEGSIEAKKIIIGNEARIDDYIKLANNGYILNPDKYSKIALALGNISDLSNVNNAYVTLSTDGKLKLGSLIFNGETSTLHDAANTWSIEEGYATFNNVNIRGTLETAIFKPTSVQAAAGVMVFRPSSKFEIIEGTTADSITNLDITLSVGDYLILSNTESGVRDFNNYFYVTSADTQNGIYQLNGKVPSSYNYCVLMANYTNSTFSNNLLIGINSTESLVSGLYGQGITFTKPTSISNGKLNYGNPLMYLGNLEVLDIENMGNMSGYGLYGDNVYLHGSLTTQYVNNNTIEYAGLNTLSTVNFIKSDSNVDTSPIIFWAGSNGITADDIKESKFQVSSNGSVYAQNAYITGTISGSDIYTSSIHGTGSTPALQVYSDKGAGIVIHKHEPKDANTISFTIDDAGFKDQNGDSFINILYPTNSEIVDISFTGTQFITNEGLVLANKYISLGGSTDVEASVSKLTFDDGILSWASKQKEVVKFTNTKTEINSTLNVTSDLILDGIYNLNFKNENNGYNLYITN